MTTDADDGEDEDRCRQEHDAAEASPLALNFPQPLVQLMAILRVEMQEQRLERRVNSSARMCRFVRAVAARRPELTGARARRERRVQQRG
jgi:hypothetical protein